MGGWGGACISVRVCVCVCVCLLVVALGFLFVDFSLTQPASPMWCACVLLEVCACLFLELAATLPFASHSVCFACA